MRELKIAVCPIPFSDEAAISVIARAAELNSHINIYKMFRGSGIFYSGEKIINVFSNKEKYEKMLSFLGIIDTSDRVVVRVGVRFNWRVYDEILFPDAAFRKSLAAYCPECLREASYWRKYWMLPAYTTCHIHNSRLYEICGYCRRSLSEVRSSLSICSDCGNDLRKLPAIMGNGIASEWFFDTLRRSNQDVIDDYLIYFSAFDRPGIYKMDHEKGSLFAYYCVNRKIRLAAEIFSVEVSNLFESIHPIYFLFPLLNGNSRTQRVAKRILRQLNLRYLRKESSELQFTRTELRIFLDTDETSFDRLLNDGVISTVKAHKTTLFRLENFNNVVQRIHKGSISVIDLLARLSSRTVEYYTYTHAENVFRRDGYHLYPGSICTYKEHILGFSVPVIRREHLIDALELERLKKLSDQARFCR